MVFLPVAPLSNSADRPPPSNSVSIPTKPPWRPRKIASSQQLLDHFSAYAKKTETNPIIEERLFTHKGQVSRHLLRKARPFTLSGFCSFLSISPQSWRYWRKNRIDLSYAIGRIEDAIYAQKFEGAAAGIFKANIISRDLGVPHTPR